MTLLLVGCICLIFGTWVMALGLLKLRALGPHPLPYLLIGSTGAIIAILMASAYKT